MCTRYDLTDRRRWSLDFTRKPVYFNRFGRPPPIANVQARTPCPSAICAVRLDNRAPYRGFANIRTNWLCWRAIASRTRENFSQLYRRADTVIISVYFARASLQQSGRVRVIFPCRLNSSQVFRRILQEIRVYL